MKYTMIVLLFVLSACSTAFNSTQADKDAYYAKAKQFGYNDNNPLAR